MKSSTILRGAKKLLNKNLEDWTNYEKGSKYICCCIEEYAEKRKREDIAERLTEVIEKRLGHHGSLQYWLMENHPPATKMWKAYEISPTKEASQLWKEFFNKVQETRHAWIDSLILEYQSKGD